MSIINNNKIKINIFGGSNTIYNHSYSNLLDKIDNYKIINYKYTETTLNNSNTEYNFYNHERYKQIK